jgi:hypothetical protein
VVHTMCFIFLCNMFLSLLATTNLIKISSAVLEFFTCVQTGKHAEDNGHISETSVGENMKINRQYSVLAFSPVHKHRIITNADSYAKTINHLTPNDL